MSSSRETRPRACPRGPEPSRRYYTDPANHQAELERFFFGMWIHAGRADEIPEVGDYVLRDVAGESVIVTRADDGAIRAFYNVCRHRGTRLCEARRGHLRRPDPLSLSRLGLRPLRAGWSPHPRWTTCRTSARRTTRSRAVAVGLWDGHIFLNLGESPRPLAEQLGGLPDEVPPLADGASSGWASGSSTTSPPTGS